MIHLFILDKMLNAHVEFLGFDLGFGPNHVPNWWVVGSDNTQAVAKSIAGYPIDGIDPCPLVVQACSIGCFQKYATTLSPPHGC